MSPQRRWNREPPGLSLEGLPPPGSGFETVEVLGASLYEAMIAAAKLWRTPWTQIARACTFERLGEVVGP